MHADVQCRYRSQLQQPMISHRANQALWGAELSRDMMKGLPNRKPIRSGREDLTACLFRRNS